MGYDLSLTRAGLEPAARVLRAMRDWDATVIHTREGDRPDLSDLPANKLVRRRRLRAPTKAGRRCRRPACLISVAGPSDAAPLG